MRTLLTFLLLASLAVAGGMWSPGLEIAWSLEASDSARDGSGNDYTGALRNTTLSLGTFGNCDSFRGDSSSYAHCGTNPIVGSSPFTITAWFYVEANATHGIGIMLGNVASSKQGAWMGTYSNTPNIGGGFTGTNLNSGLNCSDGWHFGTLTASGGDAADTVKLYVDLVQRASAVVASINMQASPLIIGKARLLQSVSYPYKGRIDEIQVWTRVLTLPELQRVKMRFTPGSG